MGSSAVERIQTALKNQNFDPGSIDGVWGRRTIDAVRKFQASKGLEVDGVVGPQTAKALFAGSAPPPASAGQNSGDVLVWFDEAKSLLGTKETRGDASNPMLLDWADNLRIDYDSDDIPWCGLFVAHCIGATLPREAMPGNPLGARAWAKFGDKTTPRLGAVMVFWRNSKASGKGHVGFYNGESENGKAYQILGGNQSDSVSIAWLSADRFLEARWPSTASSLTSGTVKKAKTDNSLSTNEA